MCLALVKPAGREIPFSIIRRGFIRNPHGAGYAIAKNGELIVKKGFFKLSEFWDSYKEDVTPQSVALVHFRWANVGMQNALNCHPWQIDENHAMIHNGTLAGYCFFKNSLSDTGNFTNTILKPQFATNPNVWKEPWFVALFSRSIGDYNKIAIIKNDGDFIIYNEGQGLWDEGVWHSNKDGIRKLPKSMVKTSYVKTGEGVKATSQPVVA